MKAPLSTIVLVLLVWAKPTLAQVESLGCYVEGECVQSLLAAINRTDTPQQCLQYCKVGDDTFSVIEKP